LLALKALLVLLAATLASFLAFLADTLPLVLNAAPGFLKAFF